MNIRKECERRGWQLLNEKPVLDCEDEEAFEHHSEECVHILDEMERKADAEHSLWLVTKRFIDPAHKDEGEYRKLVEPYDLQDFIQTTDLKNGVDVATDETDGTLIVIANGQGYTIDGIHGVVTTVFECRQLDAWTVEAIRTFA